MSLRSVISFGLMTGRGGASDSHQGSPPRGGDGPGHNEGLLYTQVRAPSDGPLVAGAPGHACPKVLDAMGQTHSSLTLASGIL